MTGSGDKPRRRRWWRWLLWFAFGGLLLLAGLAWYATTESFQERVRQRVVSELERVTGGRVELESFHTIPFQFRVDARNLTIHGREAASEAPYAHVDRLTAKVKIISILQTEFGFDWVVLEHPFIHLETYADGSTNQPQPKVKIGPDEAPIRRLFALSIKSLDVRRGQLLWNDEKVPLDFLANDISASMNYTFWRRRYETDVLLGKAETRVGDYRPVAWTGEAHFNLGRNNLEVKSLKLTSGRSRLEASGMVRNFRDLKIEGDYKVLLDLGEAAGVLRSKELRRGTIEASGKGTWSLKDFASAGKFQLKDLEWHGEPAEFRGASLSAEYAIDPAKLTLSKMDSRVFGGSVTGDLELVNWQTVAETTKPVRGKLEKEQKGTAHLHLRGLSVGELLASVHAAQPLDRLRLAGTANGTLDTRWSGSLRNAESEIAADIAAASGAPKDRLPLNAHVRASYRADSGDLNIPEFSANTPATQIRASGTLSRTATVKFSVTTTDLHEWQPIIAAYRGPERMPVRLHGRASFNGTASGTFRDATLSGNLQVEDFDSLVPATSTTGERAIHWDSISAELQLSHYVFAARNGTLHRGDTAIAFDVSAHLQQGSFTNTSPFTLHLNTQNVDATQLLDLAGYNYPITGSLALQVTASGTLADPHGDGHIRLTNAVIRGEPVQQLSSDLRLAHGEAQLNNLQFSISDGEVSGSAAYNPSNHGLRFDLVGRNFSLARVSQLQTGRVAVDGRVDFTALGSGTLEEPIVDATLNIRDLAFDQERAGDFTLEGVTRGSDLTLTGRSHFDQATLNIDGKIHLRDDWPSTVQLHFAHFDVDALLHEYLRGRVTGHSSAEGDLDLQGPLRRPRELAITGNLTGLFADVEKIKVHNQGAIHFSVNNQVLKLDEFHLVGEGTDLSATGSVQLNDDHQLDVRAQGSANLQLLQTFDPDFTTSGMVTVNLTVTGTASRPFMQGQVKLQNGAISYSNLPSGLSELNGSLAFDQNRLRIETLTARTGGGTVSFGGYVTTYQRQVNFDLTVNGQGVRLRYPAGVSSTADANLHWTGSSQSSTLSGDIAVNKLAMTPGFDFGAYLESSAQSSALPQTNPILNRIRLDVHILTAPELQMQTAVARLSGDADLRLRGTAAKPVLLGRADILEGEIYFNGAKYRLERGDVLFVNPVTTDPVLDLQASTRVRDYDITISVNGEPTKPGGLRINYRSEPPLPEADIVALLALGRTTEESAQLQASGGSTFGQDASSAILAEALNATVSSRVQRLFGVSRIKIDPQGQSTETSTARGPQVTIEQQVANNLTLTYSTNVATASQQIIQVEYYLTRNVSVVGTRDQNGVVSFDIKIRQRKK